MFNFSSLFKENTDTQLVRWCSRPILADQGFRRNLAQKKLSEMEGGTNLSNAVQSYRLIDR